MAKRKRQIRYNIARPRSTKKKTTRRRKAGGRSGQFTSYILPVFVVSLITKLLNKMLAKFLEKPEVKDYSEILLAYVTLKAIEKFMPSYRLVAQISLASSIANLGANKLDIDRFFKGKKIGFSGYSPRAPLFPTYGGNPMTISQLSNKMSRTASIPAYN